MDISHIRSKRRCTLYPSEALLPKKKEAKTMPAVEVVKHFEPNPVSIRRSDQTDELPYISVDNDSEIEVIKEFYFYPNRSEAGSSVDSPHIKIKIPKQKRPVHNNRTNVQNPTKQSKAHGTNLKKTTEKIRFSSGRSKRPSSRGSSASNKSEPPKKQHVTRPFRSAKPAQTSKDNPPTLNKKINTYNTETSNAESNNWRSSYPQNQNAPYSVVTASYIKNLKEEIETISSRNHDELTKTAAELKNEINQFRTTLTTNVKVSVSKNKGMQPIMNVQIDHPVFDTSPPGHDLTTIRESPPSPDGDDKISKIKDCNKGQNSIHPSEKSRSVSYSLSPTILGPTPILQKHKNNMFDGKVRVSPEKNSPDKDSEQISSLLYDLRNSSECSSINEVKILYAARSDLQQSEDETLVEDEPNGTSQNRDLEITFAASSGSCNVERILDDNDAGSILPVLVQIMENPLDLRYLPKDIMIELIDTYREHPALWKIKSKDYTNKNLKNHGFDALVKVCKKFDSAANREFVAKKIQSIRGSFRKELKKVEQSKKSGTSTDDIYTPTLWYFDLLLFTIEHKQVEENLSNINSPETPTGIVGIAETDEDTEPDEDEEASHQLPGPNEVKHPPWPGGSLNVQKKRKRDVVEEIQPFMRACNEFEAVGINVAAKLTRMDPDQQIYAELLIQKILTQGLLKTLSAETDVFEPLRCQFPRPLPSPTFSSASSSNASSARQYYDEIGNLDQYQN